MSNPVNHCTTRVLKAIFNFALAACSCVAGAGQSSQGSDSPLPSGFVPIDNAKRVLHFNSDRIWGTADGIVLVCPLTASASGYEKKCTTKESQNAWVELDKLIIPGHEISGIQFMFAGQLGYRQLLVYFRKRR